MKKRLRFFDKDTIPWNDYPLQDFYSALLHLKQEHPALANFDAAAEFELRPAPAGVVAFVRRKGARQLFVWANLSSQPQQVQLPVDGHLYHNLFSQAERIPDTWTESEARATLPLPPHSYQVWDDQGDPTAGI